MRTGGGEGRRDHDEDGLVKNSPTPSFFPLYLQANSGKTTLHQVVLIRPLEASTSPRLSDNQSLQQAVEKGTKIIDEDGLISLIKAAPDPDAACKAAGDSGDDVAFVSASPPPGGTAATALKKVPGTSKASGRPPPPPRMRSGLPPASH